MPDLPPDRSSVLTEQRHPSTRQLHTMSVTSCVQAIRDADRAVLVAIERAEPSLTTFIEAAEPGFLRGGRLVYLGAGTSGRLGVLDASEAPPTFQVPPGRVVGIIAGGDSALRRSSEGMEDDPDGAVPELEALRLNEDDTVIGIAAGGTTPYVRGALEYLVARDPDGAGTRRPIAALLSCSPVPPPVAADHVIVLETGPEVITGSTRMKAGTATKLALNTISTTLMIRSGRVYENLMVDVRATNGKLRDRAARIISSLTGLGRGAAFDLLERAGGEVKTAVVMQRTGVDAVHARTRLQEVGGRLDRVIDRP